LDSLNVSWLFHHNFVQFIEISVGFVLLLHGKNLKIAFLFLFLGIFIGSAGKAPTSLNFLTKLTSITKLQNF
jgi:hypothetical protein